MCTRLEGSGRVPTARTTVTLRAPAKINLRLRIVGCRPDGYHLLDSVMVPVGIFDLMRVHLAPARRVVVNVVCRSPGVPSGEGNLVAQAASLFMRRARVTGEVTIELEKVIPVGAGLGGGSSDAASVMLALNALHGGAVDREQLMSWGLCLGADVPFFVLGRPARVCGIGDRVERLDSWRASPLAVAFPGAGLSTGQVYRAYDDSLTKKEPASTIRVSAVGQIPLRELLMNDLEAAAIQIQPRIFWLKQRLVDLGASGALMAGSGSAVFGMWKRWGDARACAAQLRKEGYWAREAEILGSTPDMTLA